MAVELLGRRLLRPNSDLAHSLACDRPDVAGQVIQLPHEVRIEADPVCAQG